MVTGSGPQLNVMTPPALTAVERAWKVQLAEVPMPTTVVGLLVSTGCASAGSVSVVQEPLGFPATGNPPSPDVPLEAPAWPESPPELELSLAGPELVPLDPAPLDVPLAPLDPDAPLPPGPELELEPPSPWPDALLPWEVELPQPIPRATAKDTESMARRACIVVPPRAGASMRHSLIRKAYHAAPNPPRWSRGQR